MTKSSQKAKKRSMKFFSFCLSVHPQESLSPAGRSLKGNEACDDESVSVDGGWWGVGGSGPHS